MSGRGIIASEPPQVCELCGKIDECRPYGPGGKQVYFDCGMTKCDPADVERRLLQHILGDENA